MALSKVDNYVTEFNNALHSCDNYLEQRFQEQRDLFEHEVGSLPVHQEPVHEPYEPEPAPYEPEPTPSEPEPTPYVPE